MSVLAVIAVFVGVTVLFFALMTGMVVIIIHNGGGAASSEAGPRAFATGGSGIPVNATPAVFAKSDLPVVLREYQVEVPATTISPGLKTLRISNFGTMPHELLVFRSDLDPSAYPMLDGNINEEDPSITKVSDGDNLAPGTVQTRPTDLTTPGKYLFVCNLPGHFRMGMYAVVTVAPPASAPTVSLAEFKVTTPTDVPAGKFQYTILNNGTVQHELLVFHTTIAAAQLPLGADGNILENAPGLNKISDGDNIDPGKGQTRTIDLSQPGTYVFVCNLPGHYKAGMFTRVTVH
jgi:uncharacterized cupredoxin-like copper-binding protein